MNLQPDEPYSRSRLCAEGYSPDEIRRALSSGVITMIRRGSYLAGPLPDDRTVEHATLLVSSLDVLSVEAVVSHASALVVHGLPTWGISLEKVHVSRNRGRSGGRVGGLVHVHTAPLGPEDVVLVDDIAVTSPVRTVVDVARTVPFEQAVVVADDALHRGLVFPHELEEALDRAVGWPGVPAARRVVAFADGRSESAGESRSRVAMHRIGLPAPELQWEVLDSCGLLIGRVDFGWRERRTVGEFDGFTKYGRLLRPGQTPADAVIAEKRREDAIRGEDLRVVRWYWADLGPAFGGVATRLRRAFEGR